MEAAATVGPNHGVGPVGPARRGRLRRSVRGRRDRLLQRRGPAETIRRRKVIRWYSDAATADRGERRWLLAGLGVFFFPLVPRRIASRR